MYFYSLSTGKSYEDNESQYDPAPYPAKTKPCIAGLVYLSKANLDQL